MKTAVTDASSAILLFKTGLLDTLTSVYRTIIARAVYDELTVEGYPGASRIKDVCQKGQVAVYPDADLKPATGASLARLSLGKGERETIRLYLNGVGDFILIDDGKAVGCCRSNRIPHINALLFPRILYVARHISQTACQNKIQQLIRIGRYASPVIDYAVRCSEYRLRPFLP